MKLNSLRFKFLAAFIPLFVGSFAVFFAISYYMSSSALLRSTDQLAQEIGKSTAGQLEKLYQERELTVEALASNPVIRHGSREEKVKVLAETMAKRNNFTMLAYSDTEGHAVSDKNKDMDRTSRAYIKQVRESKKPVMTGPSVSGSNGKLITIMAYPVMDNGELTGIVYGTIELDEITKIVGDIKYMENGRVYIADQDGICIAYAQLPEEVGKMDLSKEVSSKKLDMALVNGFTSAVQQDKQISAEYTTAKGVASQAVFTPVHLANRNWIAVSVAPLSEVRADAYNLVKIMGVVALIMILIISAIIWLMAVKMCAPVIALREECKVRAICVRAPWPWTAMMNWGTWLEGSRKCAAPSGNLSAISRRVPSVFRLRLRNLPQLPISRQMLPVNPLNRFRILRQESTISRNRQRMPMKLLWIWQNVPRR